jgi:hypothetical protein
MPHDRNSKVKSRESKEKTKSSEGETVLRRLTHIIRSCWKEYCQIVPSLHHPKRRKQIKLKSKKKGKKKYFQVKIFIYIL